MPPILFSNIFNNNSAIYGPNLASTPVKMCLIVRKKGFNEFKEIYSSENSSEIFFLNGLSSGSDSGYQFVFQILDYHGQIIKTLNQGYESKIYIGYL